MPNRIIRSNNVIDTHQLWIELFQIKQLTIHIAHFITNEMFETKAVGDVYITLVFSLLYYKLLAFYFLLHILIIL